MGPQNNAGGQEERILHISSRVVLWDIQCLEVIPIVLNLGPLGHRESQSLETGKNIAFYLLQRVRGTKFNLSSGSREVEPPLLKRCKFRSTIKAIHRPINGTFDSCFDFIDELTDLWAFFWGQFAHTAEDASETPFFPENFGTDQCDGVGVGRKFQAPTSFSFDFL
jgi:hypothetical protein